MPAIGCFKLNNVSFVFEALLRIRFLMTNQAHVFAAVRFFVLLDNIVSQPEFSKKNHYVEP